MATQDHCRKNGCDAKYSLVLGERQNRAEVQPGSCTVAIGQQRTGGETVSRIITKERGILMSRPNIQPILADLKTQTRRIMKIQPPTPEQFPHSVMGLCRSVADDVKMYSQNQYESLPK